VELLSTGTTGIEGAPTTSWIVGLAYAARVMWVSPRGL